MTANKRGYLTAMDLLNWLKKLDYGDLNKPVVISEKTCGLTNEYFNDDELTYGVRISSRLDRNQDFDGWIIEGLTKKEILKFNNGQFGE